MIRTGLAALAGTSLAGCAGNEGSTATDSATKSATPTDDATTTPTDEPTESTPTETESYSVTMAPVGTVEFDSVPESWLTYFPGYADMGVALGQADGLTAVGNVGRYHTGYYDELDGVSLAKDDLTQLIGENGIDKELYLELENDVHLTDPQWLSNVSFFGLESGDITDLSESVGPFVGNTVFRRTDSWHDYRYYSMYETFEKVAQVFDETERFEAFQSFHDDYIARVQADLPAADSRPNALLCFAASDQPEKFAPYRISGKGTNKKHFHELGITDALSGTSVDGLSESNRSQIDYETMLKVDPDTLFVRGHETKTAAEFEDTVLGFMQDHNVASQLTAVENGDVYRGGPIYQGPIQNLFLTERVAQTVYADVYGEDKLFDRSTVSEIVTGDY